MKSPAKPTKLYANMMLAILLINIPLCFIFIGLLLLIPIGAWQILDALVRVSLGDRKRIGYLVISGLYLSFLWFNAEGVGNTYVLLFVLPYFMAFFYWGITRFHAIEQEPDDDDIAKHLIE